MKQLYLIPFLILSVCLAFECSAQFATTHTSWGIPRGGDYSNTGYNFGYTSSSANLTLNPDDQSWLTTDMNGDGLPDLVVTAETDGSTNEVFGNAGTPRWEVYLNTGNGFISVPNPWPVPRGGDYNNSGYNFGYTAAFGFSNLNVGDQYWGLVDLNRDSKPDLVVTAENNGSNTEVFGNAGSPHWRVYFNTGTGFDTAAYSWGIPRGGDYSNTGYNFGYTRTAANLTLNPDDQSWSLIDINGDTLPDLVVMAEYDGSTNEVFANSGSPHWKVHLNNGFGFDQTAISWGVPRGGDYSNTGFNFGYTSIAASLTLNPDDQSWSTFDINNDDLPDLVVTAEYDGSRNEVFANTGSPHWKIYLNNGNGFDQTAYSWGIPRGGDFSNAGYNFGYTSSSANLTLNPDDQSWTTTDINGDGLPDLVVTAETDGSTNEVFANTGSPHWKVHLNDGFRFSSTQLSWGIPRGGDYSNSGYNFGYTSTAANLTLNPDDQSWLVTDMDGDGNPDLLVTAETDGSTNEVFANTGSPHWRLYKNETFHPVTSISVQGSGGTSIVNIGAGLQMEAVVNPSYATQDSVIWSVTDQGGSATIDQDGMLTGVSAGDVQVTATAADVSNTTGNATITVIPGTAIGSLESIGIRMYPNPVGSVLKLEGLDSDARIELFDMKGKRLISMSGSSKVDMNELPAGSYRLRVSDSNGLIGENGLIKR